MSRYRKAGPARLNPTPAQRRWVYGTAVAGGAILVGYGVVTHEEGGLWLALVAALLGGPSALAAGNVDSGGSGESSGSQSVGG